MNKEGSTKTVTFMTPGAGLFCWVVPIKDIYLMCIIPLKCSSLLPGIDETNNVYSNDDNESSNKIVTFMTPGAWVLVLRRGHISHYSENALFL